MGTIDLVVTNDVAEIVLNRPDKMNALRTEDWAALGETVRRAASLPVRCLLVRGEGADFCAGWDLSQARHGDTDVIAVIRGTVTPAIHDLRNIDRPTIAAVKGQCLGGGLSIAMACDIVVAADDASLGSPFSKVGILPDSGAHHFLRERLGHHKASQMIYTAKTLTGADAHRMGLICESYPTDDVLAEARKMAVRIASGPTAAFAESKRILLAEAAYDETVELETDGQVEVFRTVDASEGIAAFLGKRKPAFVGR